MSVLEQVSWNRELELFPRAPGHFGVWAQVVAVVIAFCLVPGQSRSQERSESQRKSDSIRQTISSVGIRNLVRNSWGNVGVIVENQTDHPIDVLSVMYFETDLQRQYSRQVWVPPRSRRTTWINALTPGDIPPSARSVGIRTILYDDTDSGGKETVIRSSSGQVLGDALLPVMNELPTIGVISDEGDDDSIAAVTAMRLERGMTRNVAMLDAASLPPTIEGLEGLDLLVLMSDRPAADTAGIMAIRQWLEAGGRLWIMLDQVDSSTVTRFLGSEAQFHEVDRVDLMEGTIKREYVGGFAPEELSLEFENPVEFVRVLASQAEILQTIDGWPASFELRQGKGVVLCTTLGATGWVRPRNDQDSKSSDPEKDFAMVATGALGDIGFRFSRQRATLPLQPFDFRNFLFEQVGYKIVSREYVMVVLGSFGIYVLGLGLWLIRRQQLVHLGWLGPAAAAISTIVLVCLGNFSRQAAPDTVAQAQFVEATSGSHQVTINGLLSLYNQAESSASLGARTGGVFVPQLVDKPGNICRMVRTDMDQWHFEDFSLPAGLMFAPFSQVSLIDHPISAQARFGPNGIEGTLSLSAVHNVSDLVIATPGHGGLVVRAQSNGSFTADAADVLRPGEFIGGNILTDEQRRRQAVYRTLLLNPERGDYPHVPTLLAWTKPFDMNFTLPPGSERKGAALLAIPLEIERTTPGTRLTIPAPFLPYQPVGASGVYDAAEHKWLMTNLARQTMLRFQIPRGVLPIRLERAVLSISINAPSRTVEVIARHGTDTFLLKSLVSPIGQLRVESVQADALSLDDTGGLLFGINVGEWNDQDPTRGTTNAFGWSIQSLQLELTGIALTP